MTNIERYTSAKNDVLRDNRYCVARIETNQQRFGDFGDLKKKHNIHIEYYTVINYYTVITLLPFFTTEAERSPVFSSV